MRMEEDHDDGMQGVSMDLSSASTTIDPSVVQSRILQSASLQKENAAMQDDSDQPVFPKLSAAQASGNKVEYRRVRCPPHRYTPLREHWEQILTPLVEYLKLQVRQNFRLQSLRVCKGGCDPSCRNVHRVVLGTSNPPGSLDGIMNEVGRLKRRSLIHTYPAFVEWSLSYLRGRISHCLVWCFLGSF